jgi:glycerol-3-phosphate dehydrogenase (NAD(P)+)
VSAPGSVCVVGAGNWGTTLAHLIGKGGTSVRLWTRDPKQRDEINERRTNVRSTSGFSISPHVRSTIELEEALAGAELVLVAIPSQSFREVSRSMGDRLDPAQIVIHGTKGLELGTHRRMSEILQEETCARQIGVLAGPNIAPEVAAGKPAGTVIASEFPRVVEIGRAALASTQMMVFAGTDVLGVELAGALKNVVAIAAGIADEMALGENAKAFLVSRGMTELMRLASVM